MDTSRDFPEGLKVLETTFPGGRHIGVFCKERLISKGTRFGPFKGTILETKDLRPQENNTVWEVGGTLCY